MKNNEKAAYSDKFNPTDVITISTMLHADAKGCLSVSESEQFNQVSVYVLS